MPSTNDHSPASPSDASGRYSTCESQGNPATLTQMADQQSAALEALLASPEFARQQAGQQAMFSEMAQQDYAALIRLTDHILAPPRDQEDADQRGSPGGVTS